MHSPETIPSPRLRGCIREVGSLRPAERDEMFSLFSAYYADVTRPVFERDLAAKQHLVLMRDSAAGKLGGFSTIAVKPETFDGQRIVSIFSGDTVVDRPYWGQKVLQEQFARFLARTRLRFPTRRVFWFLISKGFKTYMLIARNFSTAYPVHCRPTPEWNKRLLDHLALSRYPGSYDPASGLIRAVTSDGAVREPYAAVSERDRQDPHVRFFLERNPDYRLGVELACIAELSYGALARILWKYCLGHG